MAKAKDSSLSKKAEKKKIAKPKPEKDVKVKVKVKKEDSTKGASKKVKVKKETKGKVKAKVKEENVSKSGSKKVTNVKAKDKKTSKDTTKKGDKKVTKEKVKVKKERASKADVKIEPGSVQFSKPGQRYTTPPNGDATRCFYESLYEENPSSVIAIKFCVENGIFGGACHNEIYQKYINLQKNGFFKGQAGGSKPKAVILLENSK